MPHLQCASRVIGLLVVVGIILGGRAAAATIECGDILGSGGVYTLTEDLDCTSVTLEVALIVRDGATLDMAGHQIRLSNAGTLDGVRLEGSDTRLWNGIIEGSGITGVLVVGTGGHQVQGMRVGPNIGAGVIVTSAHNRLISNETQTLFVGFSIDGDENWLVGNRAYNADGGFNIDGDRNTLLRNRTAQGRLGVQVTGDHNRVIGNTISTIGDTGIGVFGEDNLIWRNVAVDNLPDAFDVHGDCTHNRWVKNTFNTVIPACIE